MRIVWRDMKNVDVSFSGKPKATVSLSATLLKKCSRGPVGCEAIPPTVAFGLPLNRLRSSAVLSEPPCVGHRQGHEILRFELAKAAAEAIRFAEFNHAIGPA